MFEKLNSQADAFYVVVDQLVVANYNRILTFALSARLPMVYSTRDFVRSGGLMSYGPSYVDLFRRAGDYVHRILQGAKPSDMPVEQPTRFELVLILQRQEPLGCAFLSILAPRRRGDRIGTMQLDWSEV